MNAEFLNKILEKNPGLTANRAKAELLEPGAYCMHRSWGFGCIKDFDASQNKLIIDFEGGKNNHPMDPAFCIERLDILPAGNILVRYQNEKNALDELIKKQPAELIVEILKNAPNQSASTVEIENLLRKLLGETSWKRWWTKTKKLLIKDPRIAAPTRKNEPYVLREEPLTPEQEILEEFYLIKQPLKKILLAEKLYLLSGNVEEIRQDLPVILETLTEAIKGARQLNQAERLHGMWVRNDLARHLEAEKILAEHNGKEPQNFKELIEEKVNLLEPTSASLIRETENLPELAAHLPSNYQKRFLDLITRVYVDDWKPVIINLLRNSSGKFTHECIAFLVERKETDLVAESFSRWLNEQSIKGPVLFWIVKNRHSKKFQKLTKPLISPRLLNAIFYAIDNEALQATTNRRIPLADILSEDAELIPDLLNDATQETARDLAQTLILNQGFENLTKKSLLARFIKRFPKIQSLVSGDAIGESEQLIVSAQSFDIRKRELEDLINNLIPKNKEAIATAREHGDLRENSEYKMARQEQELLMARRAQLEADIERARITDFQEATAESISIGSTVTLLEGSSGKTHRYSILGAWDSDPTRNIVAYKTPLAQSLLTKKIGDTVKTNIDGTTETWTIKAIARWVEQPPQA